MAKKREQAIKDFAKGIVPLSEANPYVKVLVYGRNGSGKTRFAASGPSPLVLDINEQGTQSVRSYDGDMRQITKWEDLTYAYWFLRHGNHDYETVILDTLTMMQSMCMRHVLKEAEDRDPNREPSMPDRRAWGKLAELMKPLLLNFRNLPMHVVFVAQERVMGDEDDEFIEHVPDLSPGSRATATASVGIIGRMYQKKVRTVVKTKKSRKESSKWQTRMLVGPHEQFITKDRTGKLGQYLVEPTMADIIEAARSAEEE